MLVDAHSHLDKYADDQVEGVLAELEEQRVFTISVAVDPESYARGRSIATRSEHVMATFGIHPWEAPDWVDRLSEVEHLIDESPMVGEVGLDHRFVEDSEQYGAQREVFAHFLTRAEEQAKVVNLHCSGAERETLRMLRDHGSERVIVHWYSGPLDVLDDMISEGYLFTVGVEALVSDHIREVARRIPADQLLTELDNPGGWRWLTGEDAGPVFIVRVIDELARVRAVDASEISSTAAENLRRLFSGAPGLETWAEQLR